MKIEYLFDVLITVNPTLDNIWKACANFMAHLIWYKPQLVVLEPRCKGLSDDHHFKPECLLVLSRLFISVGNKAEVNQVLICALGLWREQGNNLRVAQTLKCLADTYWVIGLYEEGMRWAKESSEIYEQLGNTVGKVLSSSICLVIVWC